MAFTSLTPADRFLLSKGVPRALGCAVAILSTLLIPRGAPAQEQPANAFYHEFFGLRGYSDPQVEQNLKLGMMNGLTFSPPVEDGVTQVTGSYGAGLMLRLAGASKPAATSDAAIEQQRVDFNRLAANAPGVASFWNLLPEWDQSGGPWVSGGRPRYRGLSRADADARFFSYYAASFPGLLEYLRQPPSDRAYKLAAVTDHAPSVYRAFELGVELQLLERGIDELGDLSTGIAFLRGAARQYGRAWGIDFSSWRSSISSATTYSDAGVLQGGWSSSYLRRNYYAAFAAGARTIQNEAAIYRYPGGRLNPFGDVTQEFAGFALRRHPDVAQPIVSTAILIDHHAGFDPKHGVYNQSDSVWYQDIPYSGGDHMMDNFFRLAFPQHWLHGLAPGAPFADSAGVPNEAKFRAFLLAGGDPRPYEPMPSTRWGDNLDVITNQVPAEALTYYKVIVLVGDVTLDTRLRLALRDWVNRGGILAVNASQMVAADEDLVGVTLQSAPLKTASSSRWLPSNSSVNEPGYDYFSVRATTADVLAVNEVNDPLITRRRIGAGEVYLTTPDRLQSRARDQILPIGKQLLDSLFLRVSPARVNGPPVEYVVSEAAGKTVVTLINNSAAEWVGEVVIRRPNGFNRVMEYLSDQPLEFKSSRRAVTVATRLPAFEVRVIALEFTSAPSNRVEP